MTVADRSTPSRQGSAARIAQILEVAEALLLDTGSLPLSMKAVGAAIGASRALVYTYFSDGAALAAAVLEENLSALERGGIDAASRSGTLAERAEACATLYLTHIATRGPVIHIILRDRDQLTLRAHALRVRHRVVRRLARLACAELALPPREALALFEMMLAIPEEAGRLAFDGQLSLDDARRTCARLVHSSIEGIRPNGRGPA